MKEAIKANRTCRTFEEETIAEEKMKEILSVTPYLASARNGQALRYLYTNTEEEAKAIFPHTGWAGALDWNPEPSEAPTAYILLCTKESPSPYVYVDMGIALEALSLEAHSLGYASCILASYKKKEVEAILGLPEGYQSHLLLALGRGKDEVKVVEQDEIKTPYAREGVSCTVYKLPLEKLLLTRTHKKS